MVLRLTTALLSIHLWCAPAHAAPHDDLSAGKRAYFEARYVRSVRLLERAIDGGLPSELLPEAYETLASVHIAMQQFDLAVKAFAELLRAQPDYKPSDGLSPKLQNAFERARSSNGSTAETKPVGEVTSPPVETTTTTALEPPSADDEQTHWYQRWWVWALVGGVVAGAVGTSVYFYNNPSAPPGDFGPDPIRP